jgi:hypothetical protein
MEIKNYFDTHYHIDDDLCMSKFEDYWGREYLVKKIQIMLLNHYRGSVNFKETPMYIVDLLGVDMYLSVTDDPKTKEIRDVYKNNILYIFGTKIVYAEGMFSLTVHLTQVYSKDKIDDNVDSLLRVSDENVYLYTVV